MQPRLTVARSRISLERWVFDPTDYLRIINEAAARLVNLGAWKRSQFTVDLTAYDGYLVLPRRAEALLGLRSGYCGSSRSIWPMAHEFSEYGPGESSADYPMSGVIEQPDVCSFRRITTASVLGVEVAGAMDANLAVRLIGRDSNGDAIYDADGEPGELVTTTYPALALTTKVFAHLDAVILPVSRAYISVKSGTTVLGRYEPGELNPSYRCYKVGDGGASDQFNVLCSRGHVDAVAENDLLFPNNLGALKNALFGILLEEAHDVTGASTHFDMAFGLLNAENGKLRGATRVAPRVNYGGSPIPALY